MNLEIVDPIGDHDLQRHVYVFLVTADVGGLGSLYIKLAKYKRQSRASRRHKWVNEKYWDGYDYRLSTCEKPTVPLWVQAAATSALCHRIVFEKCE